MEYSVFLFIFAPKMKTFEELGVSGVIRKAIEELGFVQPMPVQEEVIPYLISPEGRDVIALAQTGTGKTAAFGIPLLERIDTSSRETQALVLSPTRELCLQITDDIRDFAKYMDGVHVDTCRLLPKVYSPERDHVVHIYPPVQGAIICRGVERAWAHGLCVHKGA